MDKNELDALESLQFGLLFPWWFIRDTSSCRRDVLHTKNLIGTCGIKEDGTGKVVQCCV